MRDTEKGRSPEPSGKQRTPARRDEEPVEEGLLDETYDPNATKH